MIQDFLIRIETTASRFRLSSRRVVLAAGMISLFFSPVILAWLNNSQSLNGLLFDFVREALLIPILALFVYFAFRNPKPGKFKTFGILLISLLLGEAFRFLVPIKLLVLDVNLDWLELLQLYSSRWCFCPILAEGGIGWWLPY